jgi:hypothetical protein
MKKISLLILINIFFNIECSKNTTKKNSDYNNISLKDPTDYNNDLLDQNTIGTGAGALNKNYDTMSDVIRLGGMSSANTKIETKGGIEITFTGKGRFEGSSAINTKYLNNNNSELDSYIVPGKSTTDIGIMASAGKNAGYAHDVITLGIDLRSRTTYGKPQESGKTTTSSISSHGISYGEHNHTMGIPLIYLRGVDLTLNINELICNISPSYPIQKLKLGFFPLEIGRGISLGAAYLVSPDVLSYAPPDVIQEFAPGFMLYGAIDKKKSLNYKLYLGIIKNLSGSNSDLIEKTKIHHYRGELFPYRGPGIFNIVSAFQIDWKYIDNDNHKVILSPYIILAHEGAGKVLIPEDSINNLFTYGCAFSAEKNNSWDIDFEFAQNIGSQYILGIDTNTLEFEQRTCTIENNPNTSIGVISNSKVSFLGYNDIPSPISITTDIIGKNATFLGEKSTRQKAINKVYKNSSSNGTIIELPQEGYSLKNSDDRFRDPYQNIFTGSMAVFDISKNFKFHDYNIKIAFALGYASGGENPNKSLIKKYDHITNGIYNGFIGIQEIYSGKMVRSAFLMNGAGKMPRVSSIPAAILDNDGNIIETVEYPSPISGFNNLLYVGSSLNFIHEGTYYNWKWNPNILLYAQPQARNIYNEYFIQKFNKHTIDPFLGTEINLFLEIISKKFEGFKIFYVGSIFIPGQYYKDLNQIPLNKNQLNNLNGIIKNEPIELIPSVNNNIGYYINLGLEFKF